jgi:hypothetical protein
MRIGHKKKKGCPPVHNAILVQELYSQSNLCYAESSSFLREWPTVYEEAEHITTFQVLHYVVQ